MSNSAMLCMQFISAFIKETGKQIRSGDYRTRHFQVGIWSQNDVALTSIRRHHVASTFILHFLVMCPLGSDYNDSCNRVFIINIVMIRMRSFTYSCYLFLFQFYPLQGRTL